MEAEWPSPEISLMMAGFFTDAELYALETLLHEFD